VSGGGRVVRVDNYQEVTIEYRRGPSYLLSELDTTAFEAALAQGSKNPASGGRPIGYFRSHTRDEVGLAGEDLDLISRYFPNPETVVLLIRPYGTRPSTAGFYFKEDGKFQSGPPLLEFPFRRRDLAPDDSASASVPYRVGRATAAEQPSELAPLKRAEPDPVPAPRQVEIVEPVFAREPVVVAREAPVREARRGRRWIWLPGSIVFLLIGVLAGFQAAMRVGPRALGGLDPYDLSLTVTPSGSDLEVKWDRQSPVIRKALKGILTIEDGQYRKPIELDMDRLQGGSELVYRHYSNLVRFRLEVFLKDSTSVAEAVDWKK
jgi:hypothetical protein